MAVRLGQLLAQSMSDLRYEPTTKRVRAMLGEHTVADTTAAMLTWEPQRVVPAYAVPAADLRCDSLPTPKGATATAAAKLGPGGYGAFALHTTEGESLDLR